MTKENIQLNNEELKNCETALREKFHKDAKVTDPEKGYLSLPWVNELIVAEFAQERRFLHRKYSPVILLKNSAGKQ